MVYEKMSFITCFLCMQDVKLTGFPTDTKLGQDLAKFASNHSREVPIT